MIAIILLIMSIIALIVGHCFRVYRMQQLIEIYEKPNYKSLIQSLSVGFFINFFVPFKIGEIFRVWLMGRKMKNGISFSLAIIIIDRLLDILFMALVFALLYFVGIKNQIVIENAIFYLTLGILLIFFINFFLKFSSLPKKIAKSIASLFNSKIEFILLKSFWCLITSLKDIISVIDKKKLIINTLILWILYFCSYILFAFSMQLMNFDYNITNLVFLLFSKNNISISSINLLALITNKYDLYLFAYLLIPLLILFMSSLIPELNKLFDNYLEKKYRNKKFLMLLPQNKDKDKLEFLELYFSAKNKEYFKSYLKVNRDINILEDYSTGSDATTLLCSENQKIFFRKYTFGNDCKKLAEQVDWLNKHQNNISLTKILNFQLGDQYCLYDMPYTEKAIKFFDYIHTHSFWESWHILKTVLKDLESNLYIDRRRCDKKSLEKYIDEKVYNNLEKIENSYYIKPLLKYKYVYINGTKYLNLNSLKKYLSKENLFKIFNNDDYCSIHGDLTIENIICIDKVNNDSYYLIDPNTGNLHNSPNLDYAKLLQSLHGNYEFLMNTKNVSVKKNNINYLNIRSVFYENLYSKYEKYLKDNFSFEQLKSIYYHEIIHWLRLMPYKIKKNKEKSVLFYAGLIIIFNDIVKKFEGGRHE